MFAGDEHLERFINSLLRKVAERRRGGRSGAGSHQELEADLAGPRACPREAGVYVLYSATGPILWERSGKLRRTNENRWELLSVADRSSQPHAHSTYRTLIACEETKNCDRRAPT